MFRGIKLGIAGVVAAFALAAVPTQAGAVNALSVYHPDQNSRSFTTTDGGWTAESGATGLCIPVLLCPAVTNSFQPTGGIDGAADGHLRTVLGDLLGVAGTTNVLWTSPAFTYTGAGNQNPTSVAATVARRADVAALLSVVGNEANYSLQLVDDSANGRSLRLVDEEPLSSTAGFIRTPLLPINPADLIRGHSYRFRITSQFIYGAEVISGAQVDYDDVVLLAVRDESLINGGNGDGNGNGGGKCEDQFPGAACFDGRRLFIKLKCFGVKNKKGSCFTRATALKSKGGSRYTFPIQRVVKAKKGKVIRARVRFKFREELERANKIVLKSVLRDNRKDKQKTTKFKTLKLIDRSPD